MNFLIAGGCIWIENFELIEITLNEYLQFLRWMNEWKEWNEWNKMNEITSFIFFLQKADGCLFAIVATPVAEDCKSPELVGADDEVLISITEDPNSLTGICTSYYLLAQI